MTMEELRLTDPMFFRCGFCHAVALKGKHVCGDEWSVAHMKALRLREQKERRSQLSET